MIISPNAPGDVRHRDREGVVLAVRTATDGLVHARVTKTYSQLGPVVIVDFVGRQRLDTPVFESAAILIHLAHAYPAANLAPPAGTTGHARFLQWMSFMSSNVYESVLRIYYPERYSTSGAAASAEIKQQAVADYVRHLEVIHDTLSPYVLGEKLSAADPYLYMLAAWYPGESAVLHARLPKLAQHAELLRQRAHSG